MAQELQAGTVRYLLRYGTPPRREGERNCSSAARSAARWAEASFRTVSACAASNSRSFSSSIASYWLDLVVRVSFVYAVISQSSIQDTYVDRNKAMKELLTSKADISHRLDHYVAFVARMCTILKKLGVEDSRIEEAKDMVARKIECELNERAINPPRDTARYQKEVGTFIWRLEAFAKNFAELRQFDQCSDVVLNRIGSKDIMIVNTS